MFNRILIANRGEIAIRIMRTCREMGIGSVAVYSDADVGAAHVAAADAAVRLGPAPASESYLRVGALIDAARGSGAEAVHPGYGFLSESAELADACSGAGLVFVGPPADAMTRMGAKIEARRMMAAAGVPVVPGETPTDQTLAALASAIAHVGFPALIKPSAGGGGIGMRVVRGGDDTGAALDASRREAQAAFGDGTLYVERLLERPRHVEVQVFADGHGQTVHLFERECSLQRRHQKVIEESPSPILTPALRRQMGEAAIAAARAVDYRNAGTVEFLVEATAEGERFYFLEMNTRLQVEHPVTELVTGLDLVRAQLVVAAGRPLPWRLDRVRQRGHAIECRIYAEDPEQEFLPQAGRVLGFRPPAGPGVRVDAGIREGDEVPVQYDPLVAKLIVAGETRAAALARARRALGEFVLLGVRTNIGFLGRVLGHPDVQAGRLDTGLLDREAPDLAFGAVPDATATAVAAALATAFGPAGNGQEGRTSVRPTPSAGALGGNDPWSRGAGWRP